MKRTAIKPGKPLVRKTALAARKVEPKPKKGPKLKACRVCKSKFEPRSPLAVACSVPCAIEHGRKVTAQQNAKQQRQERAQDRQRKRELTSPTKLAEPVRKLAQRYAVLRDHNYGCISCDKGPHWSGIWHGGHWKSVGSSSALQFNLFNINKQCSQCNFFQGGAATAYETRLRQKYGDDRVDWLKNHPRSREYTPDYLDRLAAILRKKIRRLEKRLGLRR